VAQDHAKSLAGTQGLSTEAFFAEMATLSPAMSWHTGRKAPPSPSPPDAFRPKAPTHQPGLFFWIGVEGLGQFQPTVRIL
jgi:hypothetical protein